MVFKTLFDPHTDTKVFQFNKRLIKYQKKHSKHNLHMNVKKKK